jgi:glucarate dehydratase
MVVYHFGEDTLVKINEMHITPIALSDPPLLNAAGLHAPYALRIVLELVTDSGVGGVSEIPGNVRTEEKLAAARELVIGRDPFQINSLMTAIDERFGQAGAESRGSAPWDQRSVTHVQSALEVACLDIMGKETGRPVVDLLGGKCRDAVPFAAYLFFKHQGAGGAFGLDKDPSALGWPGVRQEAALGPDGIVAQAEAMCREFGFHSIKLKGGARDPEVEVDSMFALREAFGPDVPLRLDPNAVWKVETAVQWGKKLEPILEYYEDPVRGQEKMAEVRRQLSMPLATNMCTTSFADLPGSVSTGSEDIILSDHHFWGGLRACVELGRICRTFGRGMSMHSNSHAGISLAAMTHLAAAVPNLTYAVDTHYPWQSEEVIVGGRFRFQDGALPVPTGPGLGVELDRQALSALHEQYKLAGLTERNDEIEMQKVEPGWQFQETRW